LTLQLAQILPENSRLFTYFIAGAAMYDLIGIVYFLELPVLVFVFATGSIIYFKILSESFRDKDKYEILKKLGQRMLKSKSPYQNRWVCFPVAADSGDNPQHSCHFSIK